jgi:hypothetical protein
VDTVHGADATCIQGELFVGLALPWLKALSKERLWKGVDEACWMP